ncbi:hypothetical protein [Pseudomonas mandelii]|uniref:Uncharacterized protein n=1 Tax=Pseudomonas mandelii TaxID=75612 RepID=A0A502IGH7_9PSED|nr:hypothetical protein [Pseudomonas mandelii]TPG85123.1 hypothetical protein EAH74_07460 [Pseudomonas mandelii]
MERIYKTVSVTRPTAGIQALHKNASRIADLVASGCSYSAAVDIAEQVRWFTDDQFSQMLIRSAELVEEAKQVTKSADTTPLTSADMTMNILKARYSKDS